MRYNNSGALQWKYVYGGNGNDHFIQSDELPGGNIVVAGATESFGAGGNDDCHIVKVSPSGIPIYGYRYGNSSFQALNNIEYTEDNRLVSFGFGNGGFGNYDFVLIKTDTLGNLLWSKMYGGSGDDWGTSVTELKGGNGYVMCGKSTSFGAGGYDLLIIKTDTAGTVQWAKTFGTSGHEENGYAAGNAICSTSDSGFAVTGWSNGLGVSNGEDVFIIKSDGSGDILCSNAAVSTMNAGFSRVAGTPSYSNVGSIAGVTTITANTTFADSAFCYCVPDSVCSSCSKPTLSASSSEVCFGDSIAFSLTGHSSLDSVRYYFGDGTSVLGESQVYTYTTIGTFTVDVLVFQDCGIDTLKSTVRIKNAPAPFITLSSPSPFCQGVGGLGSNYTSGNQWYYGGGAIPGATNQSYYPDSSGSYTVMVTDTNGCVGVSSAEDIIVHPTPDGDFSVSESDTICVGDNVSITAPSFPAYLWSTGATTQTINEAPFFTTVYTVTVTDANGCTGVLDQKVVVNPLPSKPTISKNGNVLTSSSATNNQWKKNGLLIGGATAQTYTVTSTGYYSVVVTNQYNCSAESDTIEFNFTGLTDNSLVEALQVFPNPTSDQLNILLSSYEKLNAIIRVRNMLGQEQLVKYNPLASGQNYIMLDVSALSKGSYLLEIQDQQGRVLTKQLFTKN